MFPFEKYERSNPRRNYFPIPCKNRYPARRYLRSVSFDVFRDISIRYVRNFDPTDAIGSDPSSCPAGESFRSNFSRTVEWRIYSPFISLDNDRYVVMIKAEKLTLVVDLVVRSIYSILQLQVHLHVGPLLLIEFTGRRLNHQPLLVVLL